MAIPVPFVKSQWLDNNGVPLAGGQLFSYQAGTSTPLATYADPLGATPNANPVILDAYGRANVFLGNSYYKLVLEDSLGNVLWTEDNINGTTSINTLRSGTINPPNTLGNDGDFYINYTTWTVFGPRNAGVWPAGVSMLGANGTAKQESLTGTYAGGNTTYTLTYTPTAAPEVLAILGTNPQTQGVDYTISGTTITFIGQNTTASLLLVKYRY